MDGGPRASTARPARPHEPQLLRYGRFRAKGGRLHAARRRASDRIERIAIARARAVVRAMMLAGLALGVAAGHPAAAGAQAVARDAAALAAVVELDEPQITGVAIAADGRVLVNSPYWSEPHGASVLEIGRDGAKRPYPDEAWNTWREGDDPANRFVCVQSVHVDRRNPYALWVLDPANPMFRGVVPGGPKLVRIDLTDARVKHVVRFDDAVAPRESYLNDVRVDAAQKWAYVTDSGTGAIVVVDLTSGAARRVLHDHPSTKAEPGMELVVDGRPLRNEDGSVPKFHADGIALSSDDRHLYYHALTGKRLYRVPTDALRDPGLAPDKLFEMVEDLGETVATDGMEYGADGGVYHTAIERNAIVRWKDGRTETLVASDLLQWPDSLAWGSDSADGGTGSTLYVAISQIHRMPKYNTGKSTRTLPYGVYRLTRQ
jgi:sugar lactone lactonase YvrE